MSFTRFNVITDDDLHASLPCASKIGAPLATAMRFAGSLAHQPRLNPASAAEAGAGCSSSGDSHHPHAGAAARSFNLDACMAMGEGVSR